MLILQLRSFQISKQNHDFFIVSKWKKQ